MNNEKGLEQATQTINMLYDSGLGDLIYEVSRDLDLLTSDDKLTIPIPVEKIPYGSKTISIQPQVQEQIASYISKINTTDGALEFPILISGIQKKLLHKNLIGNLTPLHDDSSQLNMTSIRGNTIAQKLQEALTLSIKKGQNIFIHTHTHPKIPPNTTIHTISDKISPIIKDKYGIKDPGLNIPTRDLKMLISFQDYIKQYQVKDSIVMMSIIMYDGTVSYLYIENGQFRRAKQKGSN